MTRRVALLHGFTGSPSSFAAVASGLRSRGVAVETPALLGHGVDDDAVNGFEAEVDRLAAWLRARGERFEIAGYSLGGRLAIGLVCRHPELFTSATFISATPGLSIEAERAERRAADERWCALLESEGLEAFADAWEKLPLFATQALLSEDVRRAQRAERLSHDARGLVRSLRTCGLGSMPSYLDALDDVRIPTTFVVGEQDDKFVAAGRRMQARLPDAVLRVVSGAGHNVVLERPSDVLDIVLGSLEKRA